MEKYTKGCVLFYLCGSSASQMSVTAHGANTFNIHGTANHAEPQIITPETQERCFSTNKSENLSFHYQI